MIILPMIQAFATRLEASGHKTLTDNRLDSATPSIRFRLTPRRGAFDDPGDTVEAVLEVTVGDTARQVLGRLWVDPSAEAPTDEVSCPSDVDQTWIERLLLTFVETALRRGWTP